MLSPALFRSFPHAELQFPWTSLISKPTPVHKLDGIGAHFQHGELYVKREDATDSIYGGNKVRNLEFILGEALALQKSTLLTMAPVGSNFIAALAAQARKLDLNVEVMHFSPVTTPQIEAHLNFSVAQGMQAAFFPGRRGTVPAALSAVFRQFLSRTGDSAQWVAPGGSNATGALGHVNALFELKEQIDRGEMPTPDVIVVGAGTCGTMAGLLVGLNLTGLPTRLIGVRCVDAIVCNRLAVARLANRVFRKLGRPERVKARDVELVDSGEIYGVSGESTKEVIQLFRNEEGIQLDTTYTAKVASYLTKQLSEELRSKRVLYWHTFSPKALEPKGNA